MRNIRWILAAAVVAVAALLPGSASAAPGTWKRVSTMPVGYLAYADAARGADGRLYVVGGSSYDASTSAVHDETYAFDPATKGWQRLADLPAPRERLAVVSAGGLLYAMGGSGVSGNPRAEAWSYDPAADAWHPIAPLPAPREDLRAVVSGGRIFVFGGWNGHRATTTVWRYDAGSDAWAKVSSLPTTRLGFAVANGADGRIYVAGGFVSGDFFHGLRRVDVFNPATGTWSAGVPMPTGRSLLELVRGADGKLYAIAGCCDETFEEHFLGVQTVEAYTPATHAWATKAPMPNQFGSGVYAHSAALAPNGKIYTFGGESTSGEDWPYSAEVDAFTP
jgi:N-acetylneuraminic acid mutarotase